MKDLFGRFFEGTLTEKDQKSVALIFLLPYAIISLALAWFALEDEISDFADNRLILSELALFIPWFFAIRVIQSRTKDGFFKSLAATKIWRFVGAIWFAGIVAFVGMGYVSLANALTGSPVPIMVEGRVIAKKSYSGRWAGPRKLVTIAFDGREISFNLTAIDYNRLTIGSSYGQEMKLGGLGYYYRWGRSYWI
jgi:hypothetical protein